MCRCLPNDGNRSSQLAVRAALCAACTALSGLAERFAHCRLREIALGPCRNARFAQCQFGPKPHVWRLALGLAGWVLGVFGLVSIAAAQPTPETAHFRSLTDVDGLSQMSALALAQYGEGLLWIGTQVGLNRYDGAKFRTFDRSRDRFGSSAEHDVSALLSDPDGSLWVGTLNGLHQFDPATEEVRPLPAHAADVLGLLQQRVNGLIFAADGAL